MTKQILSATKVVVLATVLSFGLSYVYAWTAPTETPPAGNVSAPLNTSATAQTKDGGLTAASLNIVGAIIAGGNMQGQHIKFQEGGDSGAGADVYSIYQESGPWSYPYPDLRIQYHTGIKYDAYQGYGGHRFYTGWDGSGNPAGLQMQITDKVYVSSDVCTTAGKCLSAAGGGITNTYGPVVWVDASFAAVCPDGYYLSAMDRFNCPQIPGRPDNSRCWARCNQVR